MEDCGHGRNESPRKEQDLGFLHTLQGAHDCGMQMHSSTEQMVPLTDIRFTQTYGVDYSETFSPVAK